VVSIIEDFRLPRLTTALGTLEYLDFGARNIGVGSAAYHVGMIPTLVALERFNELGAVGEERWRHQTHSGCRIGGSAIGLSATRLVISGTPPAGPPLRAPIFFRLAAHGRRRQGS
jgi:hypothetical protein